jgi:tRNA pseudouridine13 synthase
MDKLRSG